MEELVEKAKNKDDEAYGMIINQIKPLLYKVARTRLEDEEDVRDAISETIFIAYKKLNKLKDNKNFQAWIIRILINKCNYIYKVNNRHIRLIEKTNSVTTIDDFYDKSLDKLENKINFEELIEDLTYEERIVFVLYFYFNYNTTEISKILNLNINTVKSRLFRGKGKIAKKFRKGGVGHEQ